MVFQNAHDAAERYRLGYRWCIWKRFQSIKCIQLLFCFDISLCSLWARSKKYDIDICISVSNGMEREEGDGDGEQERTPINARRKIHSTACWNSVWTEWSNMAQCTLHPHGVGLFFGVCSLLLLIAPKYVIHHLFSSYYLHYAKFMYGIYFRLILFSWLLFSQFFHQMAWKMCEKFI